VRELMTLPSEESIPGLQTLIAEHQKVKTHAARAAIEAQIFYLKPKDCTVLKRVYLQHYLGGGTGEYDKRGILHSSGIHVLLDLVDKGQLTLRNACKVLSDARRRLRVGDSSKTLANYIIESTSQKQPKIRSRRVVLPFKRPRKPLDAKKLPQDADVESPNRRHLREKLRNDVMEFLGKHAPRMKELQYSDPRAIDNVVKPLLADMDAAIASMFYRLKRELLFADAAILPISWEKRRKACKVLNVPFSRSGFDEASARATYKQKVRQYHPDHNQDNPNTTRLFCEAVEAWNVLDEWKKEINQCRR
jgi:hypothetical protein